MDFLEFVAQSEWPVVVGGAIVMFRRQIRQILNRIHLKKVSVAGNEVEFEPDLTKAQMLSAKATSTSEVKADLTVVKGEDAHTRKVPSSPEPLDVPIFVPEMLPAALQITLAWTDFMAQLKVIYDKDRSSHGPKLKWREPEPLQELVAELGLDPAEIGAFTTLEALYNRVSHTVDPKVAPDEARRFRETVRRLQKRLRNP